MSPQISALQAGGSSTRVRKHFLPSAQPIPFRIAMIHKTRPQLAANHIDANSFNLKPRVFTLIRKKVEVGPIRAGRGLSRNAAILAAPGRLEAGVTTRNQTPPGAGGVRQGRHATVQSASVALDRRFRTRSRGAARLHLQPPFCFLGHPEQRT